MAIPFFNSRQFLTTINGYILRNKYGIISQVGVPEHELVLTDIGKRLIVNTPNGVALHIDKTLDTVLACLADINARLIVIEDTLAHM